MSMADPELTSLKDVQRELDAIKAERRRRQQALYDIHRPASSSHAEKTQQGRLATTVRTVICGNMLSRKGECSGHQLPYRPEVSVPIQLLTMAYVARPDGLLSLCPRHFMGSKVEALDLSPWDVSSVEQIDALWRENRQAILYPKVAFQAHATILRLTVATGVIRTRFSRTRVGLHITPGYAIPC